MKNSLSTLLLMALLCTHEAAWAAGGSIVNNRYNDSLTGGMGAAGPAGTFSAAYGQLAFTSEEEINFSTEDDWVIIPFNAYSPSSAMSGSTTAPATITVNVAGAYQVNTSLYFSSEVSPEDTFTQTTYTVGISVNGGDTTPVAAVYAGETGFFSLNSSALMEFSADDQVQFYMTASSLGGDPTFNNSVTLVGGGAYLMQIAD